MQQIVGGEPIRITHDTADVHEPQFSPSGTQIVFRSERAGGGIYLISALGGEARLVVSEGRGTHGILWDRWHLITHEGRTDDELYDLQEDPQETTNLIYNPERKDTIAEFNKRLFDEMERTDGMSIPLFRDSGGVNNKRNAKKGKAADFPDELKVKK